MLRDINRRDAEDALVEEQERTRSEREREREKTEIDRRRIEAQEYAQNAMARFTSITDRIEGTNTEPVEFILSAVIPAPVFYNRSLIRLPCVT